MRYNEITGMLPRASYWIMADGTRIQSPHPEILWHAQEAEKHFPDAHDALGAALYAGWVRSNAAGHYLDLQFNFRYVSAAAIREAVLLVEEIDMDGVGVNVEGDIGQPSKTFSILRPAIRFLRQIAAKAR